MILPLPPDPGLAAWRRVDARGQACASCHSPDGIELSAYGFARADVFRRATRHVPQSDAEAILAMLDRRAAGADAMRDRPLQPGGEPLPGDTPAARDLAFLRRLRAAVPTLAEGRVASEADSLRVRDETLRVDLSKLRVGFAFNRLSEDGFHGREHRTVAHWIPDVPVRGVSLEAADRYLADPSDANLRALDEGVRAGIPTASSPAERLAISKYRSLLLLQHRLRTARLAPPVGGLDPNPFWSVADFARRYGDETDVASLGLPADAAGDKRGGPAYGEQLRQLRLPWFWMGWTLDPALQRSGLEGETKRADYFVRALWSDGPYPGHLAFMLTKKLVEQGCNPAMWSDPRFPQAYEISLSNLVLGEDLTKLTLPKGEYRTRFERLAANAFRTALLLSLRDVRATGRAFHPEAQSNQVRLIAAWLRRHDPLPLDAGLEKDLLARLATANPYR